MFGDGRHSGRAGLGMRWRERKHYRTRRAGAANGASPAPSSGGSSPAVIGQKLRNVAGQQIHVSALASGPWALLKV